MRLGSGYFNKVDLSEMSETTQRIIYSYYYSIIDSTILSDQH
jgi:hypothetical protein